MLEILKKHGRIIKNVALLLTLALSFCLYYAGIHDLDSLTWFLLGLLSLTMLLVCLVD